MRVVVTRTKKKIITLRLDEFGVLQVLANNKLSLDKVKNFVESKRDWVTEQLASERLSAREKECCVSCAEEEPNFSRQNMGDMFAGKRCIIGGDIMVVRPSVESKCYLDGNAIYLPEKYFENKELRLKTLKNYLKKLSIQTVSDKISQFGSYVSLCPTRIEFRNILDGWVKCTRPAERVITLDYRICQLPEKLQHYVVVHAFSHFTNEGHDSNFWNTVSNYMPRYKSCMEELKLYDFLKEI